MIHEQQTGIAVSSLSLPQFMLYLSNARRVNETNSHKGEWANGRINKSTNEWKNERHENFGAAVLFNREIEKETWTNSGRKR